VTSPPPGRPGRSRLSARRPADRFAAAILTDFTLSLDPDAASIELEIVGRGERQQLILKS
jgi:hypothetical protein